MYAGELAAFSSGHSFTLFKKRFSIYIKTLDHTQVRERGLKENAG
jgi:hypothetical protein